MVAMFEIGDVAAEIFRPRLQAADAFTLGAGAAR
jgi:hypothetical protein